LGASGDWRAAHRASTPTPTQESAPKPV